MLRHRLHVALLGASLLGSPAVASQQGVLGATSKGEIVITVSVASRAMLTDAKAVRGDAQSACLWLGTATRNYTVTALGAPIVWRPSATSSAGRIVAPGTTLPDLSSAAARPDCGRDPALFVGYAAGAATSHPATLLIAPE